MRYNSYSNNIIMIVIKYLYRKEVKVLKQLVIFVLFIFNKNGIQYMTLIKDLHMKEVEEFQFLKIFKDLHRIKIIKHNKIQVIFIFSYLNWIRIRRYIINKIIYDTNKKST